MVTEREKEVLRRFDLWLATKVFTDNHSPFVRSAIKGESDDFRRGWKMAMLLVSVWITDIEKGLYDTDKYDLKFDTLENLEAKWNKVLDGFGEK